MDPSSISFPGNETIQKPGEGLLKWGIITKEQMNRKSVRTDLVDTVDMGQSMSGPTHSPFSGWERQLLTSHGCVLHWSLPCPGLCSLPRRWPSDIPGCYKLQGPGPLTSTGDSSPHSSAPHICWSFKCNCFIGQVPHPASLPRPRQVHLPRHSQSTFCTQKLTS